jgi:hypothetical protein
MMVMNKPKLNLKAFQAVRGMETFVGNAQEIDTKLAANHGKGKCNDTPAIHRLSAFPSLPCPGCFRFYMSSLLAALTGY